MKKILALIITFLLTTILATGCFKESKKEEITSSEEPTTPSIDWTATPTVPTENVGLDMNWQYANLAAITSGQAVLYHAENGNGIIVGVNAGHGTQGGTKVQTPCHPDYSGKVTGGSTGVGAVFAMAVSTGMTFKDGTPEAQVNLLEAQILRNKLLAEGFDVLMLRDEDDVQLDNVARSVICNNRANCHIAIHWDGDGLDYDKGCFYISVPEELKLVHPVTFNWESHEALGSSLIEGLRSKNIPIYGDGYMAVDLTQTSYSTIPSVDVELGNSASDHSIEKLCDLADGLVVGIKQFFGK